MLGVGKICIQRGKFIVSIQLISVIYNRFFLVVTLHQLSSNIIYGILDPRMFCVNKYRNTRLITGFTYGIAASQYCCKFCLFGIAKFLLSVYFCQKVETAYSCRLENTKRNKLVLLCVFY